MAARKRRIRHDEDTRAKIQTSQLINRLLKHVLGEIDMSPSQVRSAEILLSKTLPSLTSVDLEAQVTDNKTITSEAMDTVAWLSQYSENDAEVGNDAQHNGDKPH